MKCPYCNGNGVEFEYCVTTAPMVDPPRCPMCEGRKELTDEEFAIKAPLLHAKKLSDLSRQVGQLAATMRAVVFEFESLKRSKWKIR